MEFEYISRLIVAKCSVCCDRNVFHYRLIERGEYICLRVARAEAKRRELLSQQQIHEVARSAAA